MKLDNLFIDKFISIDDEINYLISAINTKSNIKPDTVSSSKDVYDFINNSSDPILTAKKNLYITTNKGAVIKKCPGTSYYTCCDYTILHTNTFCNMDCSYCILQAYYHPPIMQYFKGIQSLENNLSNLFEKNKIFRIGTGEYTDSLIWEDISIIPKFLVQRFAKQKNCILELKTKTTNIKSLLDLDHNTKTIISWSLNTPYIINLEEKKTACLKARLKAAKQAQDKGYKIGFHFDPLILYPNCETEYKKTIEMIFKYVKPENIVWISLGSFRFIPKLKEIIEKRFTNSKIVYGEFILGLDNKMRYFKPLRIKLYKQIILTLKNYAPNLLIYFCMEDAQVWKECLGFFPNKNGQLANLLDKSATAHCNLSSAFL